MWKGPLVSRVLHSLCLGRRASLFRPGKVGFSFRPLASRGCYESRGFHSGWKGTAFCKATLVWSKLASQLQRLKFQRGKTLLCPLRFPRTSLIDLVLKDACKVFAQSEPRLRDLGDGSAALGQISLSVLAEAGDVFSRGSWDMETDPSRGMAEKAFLARQWIGAHSTLGQHCRLQFLPSTIQGCSGERGELPSRAWRGFLPGLLPEVLGLEGLRIEPGSSSLCALQWGIGL